MLYGKQKQSGRVSCWLVGGLGCLGLLVLGIVAVYLFVRNIVNSDFMQGTIASAQNQRQMNIRITGIKNAIELYKKDHNGDYPPNLKALVPKYLPEDQTKPFELDLKTKLEWVYKKPKPDDPGATLVLTHKPPIVIKGSVFGDRKDLYMEMSFEYYLQKDGEIMVKHVTTNPDGSKSVTTSPSRHR